MAAQYAIVRNNDRCRAGFLLVVTLLATVLEAFGTGYYQIVPNTTNNGAYITLWDISLCNTGTCGAVTTVVNFSVCSQWAIILRAAAAFYVMADVFVYLSLVFCFLEYFAVGPQWLSVFFAILYVFFGIIGWAIIAGFYRGSYCGYVLSNSHMLYAGWATAVAGTGIVLIGVIFWLCRYCCCNPNKVRFNQQVNAPLVAPPVMVSSPAVFASPMTTTTMLPSQAVYSPANRAPAPVYSVNYASPVARSLSPMVTSSPFSNNMRYTNVPFPDPEMTTTTAVPASGFAPSRVQSFSRW